VSERARAASSVARADLPLSKRAVEDPQLRQDLRQLPRVAGYGIDAHGCSSARVFNSTLDLVATICRGLVKSWSAPAAT